MSLLLPTVMISSRPSCVQTMGVDQLSRNSGRGIRQTGLAGSCVERQQLGATVVSIELQDYLPIDDDRGRRGAILRWRRRQRLPPHFLPREVVCEQPIRAEIGVNALSVGRGR